jgi:hypothetical protein
MNSLRRVTATTILALLVLAIWSSVTHSRDERIRALMAADQSSRGINDPATGPSGPAPQGQKPDPGRMSDEEKLVRDVYARLMRYQSAEVDELSAKTGKEAQPEDYLVFELRGIHSGPIQEIYARPLAQLLTPRDGEILSIKSDRKRKGKDLPHASYGAKWSPAGSVGTKSAGATVASMLLQAGNRFANVTQYTSYQVTARLNGKERTYRALVLYRPNSIGKPTYRTEAERTSKLAGVDIVDPVITEMTEVLTDESPRIRTPWEKYSKTTLYRAVVRSINTAQEAGEPLIPADAPIGYLPGDDVTPTDADTLALLANPSCRDLLILRDGNDITGTTQNVVVGERINLSLETNPEGETPTSIQWSIGGNRVQNYVANSTTGTVTLLQNLTSPTLTYYWVTSGQQIEVSLTATIFGASVTKYAYFNVTKPDPNTPTVTLPTNGQLNISMIGPCSGGTPGPAMVFGSLSGPNNPNPPCTFSGLAGIAFTPPTTSTPTGSFFFVQLVTGDTIVYSRTGATLTCTATNTPGLDGQYPYQGKIGQLVNDAPFNPLPSTYTNSSRNFAATMYLMWQSNTTGSIPVPMGSVAWSFSGSTTQTSGTWSAPSGSGSNQPFVAASGTGSIPTWTGTVVTPDHNCH